MLILYNFVNSDKIIHIVVILSYVLTQIRIKFMIIAIKIRRENNMKEKRKKIFSVIKTVLIVILSLIIATESVVLIGVIIFKSRPEASSPAAPAVELTLDTSGIAGEVSTVVSGITDKLGANGLSADMISGLVKDVVYSDAIVNTIMSMAYPLLFHTLTELGMMDFAENIDLYPTGTSYAKKIEGSSYTCIDKDGARKPLTEVLNNTGTDWSYMDTSVSWTDDDGSYKTTTLWNTIKWGVTDKETFYKAMDDMSEGLRGLLEITIQGKSRTVNINVVEFLLNTDALPIDLDAAVIYNSSDKCGYEGCLIPLFNTLGLTEGEYPSKDEVCAYTEISDIWKAILEPVLLAVEKAAADPVNSLTSMLINFAVAIENGSLTEGMRTLRMDGDFHELATAVMGFQDGEIYNLGNGLIDIIGDMGLDISGSFNNLLDGLLRAITKQSDADMPDMDVSRLISYGTPVTLSNGSVHYTADSQKTIDFLIEYIVNEKIIQSIIDLTPLKGTEEENIIISSIGNSKADLTAIAKTLVGVLLDKLEELTA